uniref:Uncharacterized protein n=1 Tax=viral metagenome TaxID=1070528 RepID=A0A6C0C8S5_9ZZZZ
MDLPESDNQTQLNKKIVPYLVKNANQIYTEYCILAQTFAKCNFKIIVDDLTTKETLIQNGFDPSNVSIDDKINNVEYPYFCISIHPTDYLLVYPTRRGGDVNGEIIWRFSDKLLSYWYEWPEDALKLFQISDFDEFLAFFPIVITNHINLILEHNAP